MPLRVLRGRTGRISFHACGDQTTVRTYRGKAARPYRTRVMPSVEADAMYDRIAERIAERIASYAQENHHG